MASRDKLYPCVRAQDLSADLREKMAEARRVLREGDKASERIRSQLTAATIAVSQAITDERKQGTSRKGGGGPQGTPKPGTYARKPTPRGTAVGGGAA